MNIFKYLNIRYTLLCMNWCLTQNVFVYHRQSVSVSHTLIDISLPNFYLLIYDFFVVCPWNFSLCGTLKIKITSFRTPGSRIRPPPPLCSFRGFDPWRLHPNYLADTSRTDPVSLNFKIGSRAKWCFQHSLHYKI